MNREVVMTALFDLLTGPPMVFGFTADTTTGDEVLANVSDTTGLMLGMPISGPGIAEHSLIVDLSPLTLSQAATGDNTAAPLTQGFQTASRRLQHAVEEADMPAMYLVDIAEDHFPRQSNEAGRIVISCEVWVFSDAGEDPAAIPAAELNNLLDALQTAIDPPGNAPLGRRQDLGLKGVHYCRIEGEVQKDPGHNGRIAGAIIPIRIMVAQGVDNYPISGVG
jgi:hypothetical protein